MLPADILYIGVQDHDRKRTEGIMSKETKDGFKVKLDSSLLYCLAAALIGFIVRVESHSAAIDTRLLQLERRTDTLEVDLKSIKDSLYEIKGDMKILLKGIKDD